MTRKIPLTHTGLADYQSPQYILRGRFRGPRKSLGDQIMLYSIFAHYKNVRWHVQKSLFFDTACWHQLWPMYSHLFNLEIVIEGSIRESQNQQLAIRKKHADDGVTIAKANFIPEEIDESGYATTQLIGRGKERDLVWKEDYNRYLLGSQRKCLDQDYYKKCSLNELFSVVAKADRHVGTHSGLPFVAASVRKAQTMLVSSKERHDAVNSIKWEASLQNIELIKNTDTKLEVVYTGE